jgi:hypothetical protein
VSVRGAVQGLAPTNVRLHQRLSFALIASSEAEAPSDDSMKVVERTA